MFATPFPSSGESFFTAASMVIAIPTGVQIFCWIATIWAGSGRGSPSPMLFVLGFFVVFVMGGITGVMLPPCRSTTRCTTRFFVVAHLHYVLIGGARVPALRRFYYWFPEVTGRMLSERLGRWNFWLALRRHQRDVLSDAHAGARGMPRRSTRTRAETGWAALNLLATLGAVVMAAGTLLFLVNVGRSLRRGEPAGHNPWAAATLEWATSSPPPPYNFLPGPTVAGPDALWDAVPGQPVVTGLRSDVREVLVTHVLDAEPDHRTIFPDNSIWPLLTALATTVMFVGSIFTPWAVVWGGVPVFVALVGWFWPKPGEKEMHVRGEEQWEPPVEAA